MGMRTLPLALAALLSASTWPVDAASCGGVIRVDREEVKEIESNRILPGTNRTTCEWTLSTDPNHTISIEWIRFSLPPVSSRSGQCIDAYAQLIWIDRRGTLHPTSRLCGSSLPAPISTLQNHLRVVFSVERSSEAYEGFIMKYRVVREDRVRPVEACPSEGGSLSGRITSPNWPLSFGVNTSCEWLLRVHPNQLIFVRPVYVNLSPAFEECDKAQLTISDGYRFEPLNTATTTNAATADLARFCGPESNYEEENAHSYLSSTNRLVIRFRSNDRALPGDERFAFHLSWTAVDGVSDGDNETCPSLTCASPVCIESQQGMCSNRARLCVDRSLACDGHADCPTNDYSDESGCAWKETTITAAASSSAVAALLLCLLCTERRRRRNAAKRLAKAHTNNYR